MKAFFKKFDSLKGASFIGIEGYTNKFGEKANINLLTNISTMNAKVRDLCKLRNVSESDLATFALAKGINVEVFKVALFELLESAEKNVLSDFCFWIKKQENKGLKIAKFSKLTGIDIATVLIAYDQSITENIATVASQAQTDAYIHLTNGVKLHKDTMNVHVFGFFKSKTVWEGFEGIYPKVNSRDKTIAKDYIGKESKLRMNDYRQYNLGSAETIKINGTTLQVM